MDDFPSKLLPMFRAYVRVVPSHGSSQYIEFCFPPGHWCTLVQGFTCLLLPIFHLSPPPSKKEQQRREGEACSGVRKIGSGNCSHGQGKCPPNAPFSTHLVHRCTLSKKKNTISLGHSGCKKSTSGARNV